MTIEQPTVSAPTGSPLPAHRNTVRRAFAGDQTAIAAMLTVILLIVINGFVVYNVIVTPDTAGYDRNAHVRYAVVLASGTLPEFNQTREYFSAPLPYILPALAYQVSHSTHWLAKVGQLQNVPIALALTLLMVAFARRLSPDQPFHAPIALLVLAVLPVFYRSMVFFRGEPMVALFLLLAVYRLYRSPGTIKDAVVVGLYVGLAVLARQWAILAIPGLLIYALFAKRWRWRQVAVTGLLIAILSGWYYGTLLVRYGTLTAFNRAAGVMVQPLSFYVGIGDGYLFTEPLRDNYDNQFLPIMYTDIWGDYWGYWAGHTRRDVDEEWVPILARMNVVNLVPSLVIVYAFLRGVRRRKYASLTLLVGATLLGYFIFLVAYPDIEGDTIKATYMLQVIPPVALIAGGYLARYWRWVLAFGVALILHNALLFSWHGGTLVTID